MDSQEMSGTCGTCLMSPHPQTSSGCGGAAVHIGSSCQSQCSQRHTKGTQRYCFWDYIYICIYRGNCSKDSAYTIEGHRCHCFDPLDILDTSDEFLAAAHR